MDNIELAKKLEQTVKEVAYLRGLVITKFVDIELYIGAIITNYFILSDKQSKFGDMALSDPYFSFGLKRSILMRIIKEIGWNPYSDFKEDLHKAEKIRNRMAHSGMFGFDGHLIYSNNEKPMEIKKAREMHDEFMSLWGKLYVELGKIFWHIIGKPNPFEPEPEKENPVK